VLYDSSAMKKLTEMFALCNGQIAEVAAIPDPRLVCIPFTSAYNRLMGKAQSDVGEASIEKQHVSPQPRKWAGRKRLRPIGD